MTATEAERVRRRVSEETPCPTRPRQRREVWFGRLDRPPRYSLTRRLYMRVHKAVACL
nr:MAG TPA: hypothetical protein [Caudoviricetes sp.]